MQKIPIRIKIRSGEAAVPIRDSGLFLFDRKHLDFRKKGRLHRKATFPEQLFLSREKNCNYFSYVFPARTLYQLRLEAESNGRAVRA